MTLYSYSRKGKPSAQRKKGRRVFHTPRTLPVLTPCFVSITTASFHSSPDFIELAFRTPSDRICDPAVDVGFVPPSPVGAYFELSRECALRNLAVDGGPGQPGPGEDGFQTDDTVWFAHGRAASCWLFLTAVGPDRKGRCRRAREFFASPYFGVEPAVNRMDQIPMSRPLPRRSEERRVGKEC